MGQGRLTNLAVLSIERKLPSNVNFDCVIDKFALAKEREMVLLTPNMKADAEARVRSRQTEIQRSNNSSTLLRTSGTLEQLYSCNANHFAFTCTSFTIIHLFTYSLKSERSEQSPIC